MNERARISEKVHGGERWLKDITHSAQGTLGIPFSFKCILQQRTGDRFDTSLTAAHSIQSTTIATCFFLIQRRRGCAHSPVRQA